jgi:hypothetical protein
MTTYQKAKARARELAIKFQQEISDENPSWWEICDAQDFFRNLGRRYGLLREFRENGIC